MTIQTYRKVTGLLFLIIAGLHALRLINQWGAVIGGFEIPMWASVIAVVVAGYLSYQGLRNRE